MLAYVSIMELVYGWGSRSPLDLISNAKENALKATRIEPDDETARTFLAAVYWMSGDHDKAIEECEAVLSHNSNASATIGVAGIVHAHSGPSHYELAVECLEKAIRLSPNDPWLQFYFAHRGTAEYLIGRYKVAIDWYQKSIQRNPDLPNTLRMLMAAYAMNGDLDKATEVKKKIFEQYPAYSIEDVTRRVKQAYKNPDDFEHTLKGLRLAGVPEN